jgi:hypothetical protein
MLALIAAGIWVRQQQGNKSSPPVAAGAARGAGEGEGEGEGNKTKASASIGDDRARVAIAARAAGQERALPTASDSGNAAVAAAQPTGKAAAKLPDPATVKKGGARAAHAAVESIPPEVAAQLVEADRLLAAGDAAEAIRKARQSFFTLKTDRGWALLARAFCARGDLENAKASFRNLRAGAPDRAAAARACKAHGIDLR